MTKLNTVQAVIAIIIGLIAIYQAIPSLFPESKYPKYIGCFRDADVRDLSGDLLDDPGSNHQHLCFQNCQNGNFKYAGLQFGRNCFCGDNDTRKYDQISEANCNFPCPGKPLETCGGDWANAIYQLRD